MWIKPNELKFGLIRGNRNNRSADKLRPPSDKSWINNLVQTVDELIVFILVAFHAVKPTFTGEALLPFEQESDVGRFCCSCLMLCGSGVCLPPAGWTWTSELRMQDVLWQDVTAPLQLIIIQTLLCLISRFVQTLKAAALIMLQNNGSGWNCPPTPDVSPRFSSPPRSWETHSACKPLWQSNSYWNEGLRY